MMRVKIKDRLLLCARYPLFCLCISQKRTVFTKKQQFFTKKLKKVVK